MIIRKFLFVALSELWLRCHRFCEISAYQSRYLLVLLHHALLF